MLLGGAMRDNVCGERKCVDVCVCLYGDYACVHTVPSCTRTPSDAAGNGGSGLSAFVDQ